MANYYESARTNYFRVKDADAFKAWLGTINGVELITDDKGRFGVLFNEDGVPSSRYNDTTEDWDDFDFMEELAPHLADDSVAVLMGAGAEKLRYVQGYAVAINNKGEVRSLNLDAIYGMAKELGSEITEAQY